MYKPLIISTLLLPALAFSETGTDKKATKSKLSEDPTSITTKLGVNYSNNYDLDDSSVTLSGSLALDPVRKINVRIDSDGSEWRIGGSWLFDLGIVNFNVGKREFNTGAKQNNYSVGTFVPLSFFDIEPFGVQIFPMAGYTYNDGDVACEVNGPQCFGGTISPTDPNFMLVPSESHSGYAGAFALKPLAESLTLIMFGAGSIGSNDYSGYWFGTGLGYTIDKKHSLSAYTAKMDNNYGSDTVFSFTYSYQFN